MDGGADAILEAGFKPAMIVGDMDSATDAALRCGAELVVHAFPDGRAPGRERLDKLGLKYKLVPAPATSEDVAMLIAAEKGAELIVTVGSHFNLIEFLEKNRAGMSSTFLTRLRIGEILVDAKGVNRLYRPVGGPRADDLRLVAALITLIVIVVVLAEPRPAARPALAEAPDPARPQVAPCSTSATTRCRSWLSSWRWRSGILLGATIGDSLVSEAGKGLELVAPQGRGRTPARTRATRSRN